MGSKLLVRLMFRNIAGTGLRVMCSLARCGPYEFLRVIYDGDGVVSEHGTCLRSLVLDYATNSSASDWGETNTS